MSKDEAIKTLDETLAAARKVYREAVVSAWKAYKKAVAE